MSKEIFTNNIIYKLNHVVAQLNKLGNKVLKENLGITYGEFLLMMTIVEHGNKSQSSIVNSMGISKSVVSHRVKTLVNKSLLLQTQNPINRREVIVDLTDEGKVTIKKAYNLLIKTADRAIISATEMNLVDALDTIQLKIDDIVKREV